MEDHEEISGNAGLNLQNEAVWLQMLADRNASTHLYNQETSREIFSRISSEFVPELLEVFRKMSEES